MEYVSETRATTTADNNVVSALQPSSVPALLINKFFIYS